MDKKALLGLSETEWGAPMEVPSRLFTFYSSKFAHTFLSEAESDLDFNCNYIPQEASTELLVASKLPQHVLEIVRNKARQSKQQHNMSMPAPNHDGLNQAEFVVVLKLVALAQASLLYNLYYLFTHAQHLFVERLPAIWVDKAFVGTSPVAGVAAAAAAARPLARR